MRLSFCTMVVIIVPNLVLVGIYYPLKERAEEERRKERVKARMEIAYWQNIFCSLAVWVCNLGL